MDAGQHSSALFHRWVVAHTDPSARDTLPLLPGSLLLIFQVISPSRKASLTRPDQTGPPLLVQNKPACCARTLQLMWSRPR